MTNDQVEQSRNCCSADWTGGLGMWQAAAPSSPKLTGRRMPDSRERRNLQRMSKTWQVIQQLGETPRMIPTNQAASRVREQVRKIVLEPGLVRRPSTSHRKP